MRTGLQRSVGAEQDHIHRENYSPIVTVTAILGTRENNKVPFLIDSRNGAI